MPRCNSIQRERGRKTKWRNLKPKFEGRKRSRPGKAGFSVLWSSDPIPLDHKGHISSMSSLNFTDRKQLERLYGMGGGTVLDFSNRTFQELIFETTGADIYSAQFSKESGSKAHRLRAFWELKPDRDVGKLILAFCQYQREFCFEGVNQELWTSCVSIGNRLCGKTTQKPKVQTTDCAPSTEHNPVPEPTV